MPFRRLLALAFLAPAALGAQFLARPAAAPQADSAPPVAVDVASPRASVQRFFAASRANRYEEAADYLETSGLPADAILADAARRFKSALDAKLWVDIDALSPLAEGKTDDGLPRDREDIGVITLESGRTIPVRMSRVGDGAERHWVFTARTISSMDSLYQALPDYWIRENLPRPLLDEGPFEIRYWQWIALFVLIPLSGLVGLFLGRPTRAVLRRLVAKTDTDLDDKLVSASREPIILLWSVLASRIVLKWIALAAPAQAFVVELQAALAIIAVFWIVLRAIGVLQRELPASDFTKANPAMRNLIPLGGRIARVLVFLIAVLTVISQFGYPIATILAGLGIGGIAVALGAQKSLEHFFGSVSIGVDQPFRVGDWVNVGGTEGEIEAIGLRSTRIRTMDRTLLSIPNGQLAETRTENFTQRERIRFRTVVGLEYGTSAEKIRAVRDGIEFVIRAHPKTWQDRVVVRFFELGSYSLNIEAFGWVATTDADEFRRVREELLLSIMEVVEKHGASFAFPTQTVLLPERGKV
jgi:MscS family membrane protein